MTAQTDNSALRGEARRFAHSLSIAAGGNLAEDLANRYRLLLDTSGLPIIYFDADGSFLYLSRQAAEHLGDTPQNIVGKTVYDFFSQDEADRYVHRFHEVIAAQEERWYEDKVVLPSGVLWFWSVLHPFNAADGTPLGVQIVSHDITEKKQVEREQEEQLAFERLIADVASQLVDTSLERIDATINRVLRLVGTFMKVDRCLLFQFSRDYANLSCTHEWHAADVESAIERLTNQSVEEFPWIFQMYLSQKPVVVPDTRNLPTAAAREQTALLAHKVQAMVAIPIQVSGRTAGVLCLDVLQGRRHWPDSLIARLQLVGQVLLTALQRVSTEHQLEASRKFAQALTEASPHIVYVFDLAEGRPVYVSPQVEQELGITQRQVYALGTSALDVLVHAEDLPGLRARIDQWPQFAEDPPGEELIRLKHANGEWRCFARRVRVFQRDSTGRPQQLIGTMRDVTDQHRAEEELQDHRDKLIHVGRLSSMGEMVAGIAHELGQPLYSIMNYAKASQNVLESHQATDLEETHEWLEKIEQAAARAGEIIRRFRDFARRASTHREPADIRGVIQDAIDLLSYELRQHNVRVETVFPEQPLMAKMDRVQILQTCVNLLQNASESMAESAADKRIIEVHATTHNEQVCVIMSDRGPGLPDNVADIFESFVSTKSNGLGMGLAICKTIVEQHGGTIRAEANPLGGAMFSFTIPSAKDSKEHDDG